MGLVVLNVVLEIQKCVSVLLTGRTCAGPVQSSLPGVEVACVERADVVAIVDSAACMASALGVRAAQCSG